MPLYRDRITPLDGPRLPPRKGGAAESLVVLLHGYGADGRDLIDLGESWGDLLPGTAFVSPHAPEPCGDAPVGRQWFALHALEPHELVRGVDAATPSLCRFVEAELNRLNLPPQKLALVGFSQGGMMALNVGLGLPDAPAAVLSYSGMWAGIAHAPAQLAHAPPTLLVHGAEDEVIPYEALFASANALALAGVPVEWHLSEGLGHGIDEDGISRGGAFLAEFLTGRVRTAATPVPERDVNATNMKQASQE